MCKYTFSALLLWVLVSAAQPLLQQESDFLGIPGVDSLSVDWFLQATDSACIGLIEPMDVSVLRLSSNDYRFLVLNHNSILFTEFRLDQHHGVDSSDVVWSGTFVEPCSTSAAMCLIQYGEYFDLETDRVAVTFPDGALIGVYQFKEDGTFELERSFTSEGLLRPAGIYWAFDNFFVVDDSQRTVIRMDSTGQEISRFGSADDFDNGYEWIGDLSGYVDEMNEIHIYVADAVEERIDHLVTSATESEMRLVGRAYAMSYDTLGITPSEAVYVPGAGIAGLNWFRQRLFLWSDNDSLSAPSRRDEYFSDDNLVFDIQQACGRLITSSVWSGGWVLRAYRLPGAVFDNPQPAPRAHWTIDMSPVIVFDSLHVLNGDTLTVDAGVEVLFDQGGCLVVDPGGMLVINGTSSSNVLLDARDTGDTWAGILVNGGKLDMEWAEFFHATPYTIHTDAATNPMRIDHCLFDGTSQETNGATLLLMNSPTVSHNVTNSSIQNVADGKGLYVYNCSVDFVSDTIRNCAYVNSYIKKVTGKFRSCVFEGRVSNYSVMTYMATCTPDFKCCTFKNLAPVSGSFQSSIYCMQGTAPTFGGENFTTGVSNVTDDSSAYLLVIEGVGVLPVIDAKPSVIPTNGGHNDWKQRKTGGKLIEWRNRSTTEIYSCEDQYWNTTPNNNLFSPTGAFDYTPPHPNAWGPCGGAGAGPMVHEPPTGRDGSRSGSGLDEGEDDLYAQALQLEDSGLYAEALDLFHIVATSSPDPSLRWYAATHAVTSEAFVGSGSWIPALIDSLIAVDSTYDTRVYGNRVRANYHLNHQEYENGIDVCVNLLNSGLTFGDSIYVSIDLLSIEMAAGLIPFGGLDGAGVPDELRVGSLAEGLALEQQLLQSAGSGGQHPQRLAAIPTQYTLYQNYPNPFNPLTEIKFDLPERAMVELRIFNSLGQEVTTLISESRDAGAYTVTWDASSVASGLYIYQLKAGSFTDSKKMVLLK